MSIKRIMIVGPLPPPAGGMANQTRKLAQLLRSEGVLVDVVQTNAPYRPQFISEIKGLRALFRFFPYLFKLYKHSKKADVIHIMANSGWSWHLFVAPAILIANWCKVPVIVNYRGGYARDFFKTSWHWVKLTLNRAQRITVPSPFLAEIFEEYGKASHIVPNVLDETLFKAPTQSQLSSEDPHIVVTRNLELIYDVATSIRAFSAFQQHFPNATLSIAGTGPEKENLQALIKELDVNNVTFTGRLNPTEIAQLYHSASIMLNSSIVDNTPNSIIESLACGTPVVSTNVGGIPKLITHEKDALLVSPHDHKTMAEHMLNIMKNTTLRTNLICEGQKTISQFYWSNVWQKLQHNYHLAQCHGGQENA